MAKKIFTQSTADERIARTEDYAESVRKQFNATVSAILKLKKDLPKLDDGVMYSFDGDSIKVRNQVAMLLKRLHASTTMTIQKGIKAEWGIANKECDDLIKQAFGQHILESIMFRAWASHNTSAMNAFVNRSDAGMNLSDRVWQTCRQLRDEMEIAMTVGIGSGESASGMSRAVRQCLNDPDLMFRRFRFKKGEDENGNPIWGKKWKKRVIDPDTGKVKFVDYDRDSYIPKGAGGSSRGVYKSAYKNAMRVTRTETNMAYRRADFERWQKMDFVLGIRIELSHQHPKQDICDAMEGDYPKGFYFGGWHPHCFCYAKPILVSEDEMAKVSEEFMKGNEYIPKGKKITDTPQGFKDWVAANQQRIVGARTLPYWVKDNPLYVDAVQGIALTPEISKISPERQRLLDEKEANREARNAKAQQIREERNKQFEMDRKYSADIMGQAQEYPMDVDVSRLEDLTTRSQYIQMAEEARRIEQQIIELKKREEKLKDLIPDVQKWHKGYSIGELESAYSMLESRIAAMGGFPWVGQESSLSAMIATETNPVVKAGLEKRLDFVKIEVEVEKKTIIVESFKGIASTSGVGVFADYATKAEEMLTKRKLVEADSYIKLMEDMKEPVARYDALMGYYKTTPSGLGRTKTVSLVGKSLIEAEKLFGEGKIKEAMARIEEGEKIRARNEASNAQKAEKRRREKEEAERKKLEEANKKKTLAEAESFEDLKEILGADLPKTLVEYEEALRKYPCLSASLAKQQAELEAALKKMFEDNDWGVAAREAYIESILDKGVLNQFQTGTSGGYNRERGKTKGLIGVDNARLTLSHRMYAPSTHKDLIGLKSEYHGEQFEREEYEKYGHLLSHDMKVSATKQRVHYGNVQIRMRKDKVVPTWTYGDTLDNACGRKYLQPTLAIDPKIHSFDEYVDHIDPKIIADVVKFERKIDFDSLKYIEMQYHGKVGSDCIESLLFEDGKGAITESIKRKCQAQGIKIFYYDSAQDKVVQIMLETKEEMVARIQKAAKARQAKRDAILAKQGLTAEERVTELLAERQKMRNIAKDEASKFLTDFSKMESKDTPFDKIKDKLSKGDYFGARHAAEESKTIIAKMEARKDAVRDLIPGVDDWHRKFTMTEIEEAHRAIKAKMNFYATERKFVGNNEKLLEQICFDIKYVENPAKYKAGATKHDTWPIVQEAYKRKRDELFIGMKETPLRESLKDIKIAKASSGRIEKLIEEAKGFLSSGDTAKAYEKMAEAEKAAQEAIIKAKEKKSAKNNETKGTKFKAADYSAKRKREAQWFNSEDAQASFNAVDAIMTKQAGELWEKLSFEEKHVLWLYTSGSCYINEPFYKRYASVKRSLFDGSVRSSEKDINILTSILEKSVMKQDMWVQHCEDVGTFLARFGVDLRWEDLSSAIGKEAVQDSFLSTSCAKYSYFSKRELVSSKADVVMSIYMPKGTKGMYMEPFAYWGDGKDLYGDERTRYKEKGLEWTGKPRQDDGYNAGSQVEFLLQRGSKLKITKAEYKDGRWYVECELTEQVPVKEFSCGY